MFLPTDNSVTKEKLDAGVYKIRYSTDMGYYLIRNELTLDELINLPIPKGRRIYE